MLSATVGDGATGKTTLALTEAIAMAAGKNLLGIEPVMPARVLYWSGEESRAEIERRVIAICQHYRINAKADLDGKLFLATGDEHPLCIASSGREGVVAGDLGELRDFIDANNIDALVIDPFVACHRVPENDNTAIDFVAKQLARLASAHHIAVEAVHHSRKPPFGGVAEIGAADARGASAFLDAVRSARVLNRMTEAEGQQAGVEDHRAYFRLDNGKANYAPASTTARWFKKISVLLPNGDEFTPCDNVGVVAPWRFPGVLDAVTEAHMLKVRTMAAAGTYRADAQSSEWIGRAVADVLNLDADSDADRKRIKRILKLWVANGVLAVVQRKDARRHDKSYVMPGNWSAAD